MKKLFVFTSHRIKILLANLLRPGPSQKVDSVYQAINNCRRSITRQSAFRSEVALRFLSYSFPLFE